MRYLRTVSTQRLLAILAGLIIAVAGGTAIAVAAAGSGPTPPRESLAQALHQAATAPSVTGISARITFTNNLIGSTELQGTDPILSGASGRLWVDTTGHRMRLELQGQGGDAQVVVDNGSFSIYDPTSNTLYKGTLPSSSGTSTSSKGSDTIPTVAQIQTNLTQLMQHVTVLGPLPRNVAGQPAYKVKLSPKHDGGLLGDVQLAWDATHGIPLGIAIYARDSNTPVLELKATQISYGPVSSGDLTIKAPAGAKVVQISSTATGAAAAHARSAKAKAKNGKGAKHQTDVTGPAAVQAHLPFTLAAPKKLVGLPRQSVALLNWGGQPAALVTYGQGLGGIAVIQQTAPQGQASSQSQSQGASGGQSGLSLPTVSINGHSGQELATALGTVLHFTSGSVEYTVLGSVPPTAAEAAAKALVP
jgi:outer membrane lipoprotein-sorting protein